MPRRQLNVRLPEDLIEEARNHGALTDLVERGLRRIVGWDEEVPVAVPESRLRAIEDRVERLEKVTGLQ